MDEDSPSVEQTLGEKLMKGIKHTDFLGKGNIVIA